MQDLKFDLDDSVAQRTHKSNSWIDTIDINSDGNVDQCELAYYMSFLGVPEKDVMEKAKTDIQFTMFTAHVEEERPYISKEDHLKYALNILKFGFVLQ